MNKKQTIMALAIIIALGIFLRSYGFHDWLRFNADQARDAGLAISAAEGRSEWPLLGPMAGGTGFKLGPVFYYFQIVSVKLFGSDPQAAAFPDLVFSILAIPLFFLLAKIYFKPKIALALTWLYTISYFVVKYSRFAWNPNSTSFFVMLYLYSFYGIINSESKKTKAIWAIACGLALGISVQLHTSLLIILPVVTIIALALLFKKEMIKTGAIAILLATAVFVNVPQMASEIKTGGLNTLQFIYGAKVKNTRNSSVLENAALNISCHIKANRHMLTGLGDEDECGFDSDQRTLKMLNGKKMTIGDKIFFVVFGLISIAFFLGGYFLLWRETKNEKDEKRKLMLLILSIYVFASMLFFTTWATELSVRFFLGLSFVPFLLLGLCNAYFSKKMKSKQTFLIAAVLLFSLLNIWKISGVYTDLSRGGREINGNFEYATLGEEVFIVDFLRENSKGEKTAYLDAQAGYLFKMLRPLQFLSKKYDFTLVQLQKEIIVTRGSRIFYIKSADTGCQLPEKSQEKYSVEKCSLHGQFAIFSLIVK